MVNVAGSHQIVPGSIPSAGKVFFFFFFFFFFTLKSTTTTTKWRRRLHNGRLDVYFFFLFSRCSMLKSSFDKKEEEDFWLVDSWTRVRYSRNRQQWTPQERMANDVGRKHVTSLPPHAAFLRLFTTFIHHFFSFLFDSIRFDLIINYYWFDWFRMKSSWRGWFFFCLEKTVMLSPPVVE